MELICVMFVLAAFSVVPCPYSTLRDCWRNLVPCTYEVPPTRVCGVNSVSQGTRMMFDGPCEFNLINECVGPYPSMILLFFYSLFFFNFILYLFLDAFTEIPCWD